MEIQKRESDQDLWRGSIRGTYKIQTSYKYLDTAIGAKGKEKAIS